uniref:Neurotransmitter-gated ion-channel transmembrane domain-containing protein n=1 Tax=Acrobeloides nanus TaxID=290746 RepID=A0A914DH84_9BILA
MASYAWTTDDIVYAWKDVNPIQLNEGLQKSLPQFTLSNVTVGYCHIFVSWISFWLDPSSVPGRVTLGVTTLLTLATQVTLNQWQQ